MESKPDSLDIEAMVKEFLVQRFDIPMERLKADVSMRGLGLDSMIMLDVMLEAEDRLGIRLGDLSMPADPTLADIVNLIQRNLSNQPRS